MEQDIVNEKMEQWLRENEEYNLQVQEYYSNEKSNEMRYLLSNRWRCK
jgi:hypothetical protein